MYASIFILLTMSTGNQVGYNCNRFSKIEHLPGAAFTKIYLADTFNGGIDVMDTPSSIVERCNKR